MAFKYLIIISFTLSLLACKPQDMDPLNQALDISVTKSKSAQTPNLWIDQGQIHMTWTEENGDMTTLYYKCINNANQVAAKVASGRDWFVNWADFSSIISHPANPEYLMTHWLEKSSEGTYDYDIKISSSNDTGRTWSEGKVLHGDGIAAEHGFVSVAPYDDAHLLAGWLDGRNTKTADPNMEGKKLPMSLRAGLVNITDRSIMEYPIDLKVCDCCQTTSIMSEEGILIAYRDRTDEEIRDITIQKFSPDGSQKVFNSNDNWTISGCPVNGPALASDPSWNAMTWYTAADSASVYMVFGKKTSFDKRIKIDNGNPLGRVDIEIVDNKAYVTWLEMNDQRAEIRLKIIDLTTQTTLDDKLITYTSPERRSGFPILKLSKNHAYIAYTEVLSADHTTVRLKQITL